MTICCIKAPKAIGAILKVFVKTKSKKGYKVIFSTDEKEFGGWNRIDKEVIYNATDTVDGKGFYIYLPSRSAVVLKKQ